MIEDPRLPDGPVRRRELIIAALLLLVVNGATALAFWLDDAGGPGVGFASLPLDDGWIHLVYARSVAETLRPEYNPGVLETGMTSPLWVFLNAAAWWPARLFDSNPTLAPKFLSCACGWLTALLLFVLARRRGASASLALAGAALLSIDPQWCFARASGMEPTLLSLLALLAVLALDVGDDLLLGCALAAAVAARPEGLLLAPLAWAQRLWPRQGRSLRPGQIARLVVPLALVGTAWVLFNLNVSGRPLPNTFYVKARTDSLLRWDNLFFLLRRIVFAADFMGSAFGLLLLSAGLLHLSGKRLRDNFALLLFPPLFVYGLSVTHSFHQDWPFYWTRYVHPVFPFLILILSLGPEWLRGCEHALARRLPALRHRGAWVVLSGTALVVVAIRMGTAFPKQSELFSRNCRDIQEGTVRVGTWMRSNSSPGDWIAAMDAGAIRFFSDRPVLDLGGLNSHRISLDRSPFPAIEETRPRYFALVAPLVPEIVQVLGLIPVDSVTVSPLSLCECPIQETVTIFVAPWARRPTRTSGPPSFQN